MGIKLIRSVSGKVLMRTELPFVKTNGKSELKQGAMMRQEGIEHIILPHREKRKGIFIGYLTWLLIMLQGGNLLADPNPSHYNMFNRSHYSEVFKGERRYRLTLPANYVASGKRYPVIYFLHGWSGWNPGLYAFDKIDSLIQADDAVLLVMPDGFISPSDRGPYNVGGNHLYTQHQVQYKDYFIELVDHIDTTYRTLPDRAHRAITGQSMGGFMTYFLSGKYPHLVCTAVNSKGSPEFPVGYPNNNTLLSFRYAMRNYQGVPLMFHNSSNGELHYLNVEVHQGTLREQGLDYVYKVIPGGHGMETPGEIENFQDIYNFIVERFADPLPQPKRWHHLDLYPDFEVWDYQVTSDLNEPGFIEFHGVTQGGLGLRTKKWMPQGRLIPGVTIDLTTAPIYQPSSQYTLFDYNVTQDTATQQTVASDEQGRISLTVNHESHELGIYRTGDPAEVVCIGYTVDDTSRFLKQGQEGRIKLQLLNRGGSAAEQVSATLSVHEAEVTMTDSVIPVGDIPAGTTVWTSASFGVSAWYDAPDNGSPFEVRCNLTFTDNNDRIWKDELDVPVFFNVAAFTGVAIDDGRDVLGDRTILGTGNGNRAADAGETIMIYVHDHRTRLYTEDPFIEEQQETLYDENLPNVWGDGTTRTSLIRISDNCPAGYKFTFLANYETMDYATIRRRVHWGTVTFYVGGRRVR